MPTRKQRRRKAKTFRHEFDFVTYDEEGNEVEVDPTELRAAKAKESPKGKGAKGGKGGGRSTRATREVLPPSWERALKRGGLMGGGLLVIFIVFLKASPVLGIIYGLAMIPMTYWLDRFAYRNYLRKQEKS
jgi:hypothetical protein